VRPGSNNVSVLAHLTHCFSRGLTTEVTFDFGTGVRHQCFVV